MADEDNDVFAIEVDADNYGEAAAADTPAVSRTHQSEAAFQAVKSSYTAKIDGGTTYQDFIAAVPVLTNPDEVSESVTNGHSKVKLGKRDSQLLGYAVGELYYDKDYAGVVELCQRVKDRCEFDVKTAEALERWCGRCRERMG
ncbi:hypothetical protein LTR09_008396 [Extremus antarcticus]|uniref:Uncharacterized protein n=1 Tax=Extremus antarcticus TaxID=702011 RepID=A0AAJ0DHW7_9PEZI|nr:hypothetical protein LTR09_008396 [Extremus antarcticus]